MNWRNAGHALTGILHSCRRFRQDRKSRRYGDSTGGTTRVPCGAGGNGPNPSGPGLTRAQRTPSTGRIGAAAGTSARTRSCRRRWRAAPLNALPASTASARPHDHHADEAAASLINTRREIPFLPPLLGSPPEGRDLTTSGPRVGSARNGFHWPFRWLHPAPARTIRQGSMSRPRSRSSFASIIFVCWHYLSLGVISRGQI